MSARSNYPHPIVAREGWGFLVFALVIALAVTWLAGAAWSAPFWAMSLFVLQFFRDPAREIPGDEHTVVSPADGRVVAVETGRDPYLERDALKVSVFMNVFNVHANRSPVGGEIKQVWYSPGSFINAALDKASLENERNALWIRSTTGADIACVQVAGLIARRVLCYVQAGDSVSRGDRFGFIRFGSRVDVYLPTTARVSVGLGDRVYSGSSVLALLQ